MVSLPFFRQNWFQFVMADGVVCLPIASKSGVVTKVEQNDWHRFWLSKLASKLHRKQTPQYDNSNGGDCRHDDCHHEDVKVRISVC